MRFTSNRRPWLLLVLCFGLVLFMSPGSVEAKKKDKGRKKQAKKQSTVKDLKMREMSHEQLEAMLADYSAEVAAEREGMHEAGLRRMALEYEAHQETGAPYVRDLLIISGGGAKGAFGAGFFLGWKEVKGPMALPEFDVVTGVSTGALIAPFAFIGTEEAYTSVAEFYANPDPNWSKKRGPLYINPSHVSLFNSNLLQQTIRENVDEPMIQAMADAAAEHRLLEIGATNLDLGIGRVFDLGHEATEALRQGSLKRVHSILLASSAIPGVFPPVAIDDLWYADGGATANLTLFVTRSLIDDWRALYPDAPLPKFRVWIVINQQLRPELVVTKPKWISVAGRGLDTATHSLQLFAMQLLSAIARDAEHVKGVDVEFRWVAIPDDAPKRATKQMFDREYMVALEELGKKMGADPSSWNTDVPSIYSFEDE